MAHSDAELIKRTLDGDETAFGFLVDKYKGAVHALAYRKIGNFQTAEEITQDTFLKAHQKLSTLKDWRHFPGWLYTIASRFCLMWHRKQRLPTQPLNTVEMRHVDALASAKYADEQTRQAVRDALEELPESQRTVLTLHYLGGMTCEEIGRFIGTSRGAVLDRLYRARAKLKEELIPMMQKTLGAFQLPPTFTQQMMDRIDHLPPTPTPQSKPFLPWLAATATLVVALFIGFGQRAMTRFQQPYSLDAPEPAVRVELIDAPVIHLPNTKPALVNRPGQLNARDDKNGTRPDGTAFAAAANAEAGKGLNDTNWRQTNGPYGGSINTLFRASDGTLYAATDSAGVFRSSDDGDSWVPVNNGLDVYPAGQLPHPSTITEANGMLYLSTTSEFFYSNNRGEAWQWVEYPDRNPDMIEISVFGVSGTRIYISRIKDGIAYSDDYGESWMPIHDDLPDELTEEKFVTVGTTLFAKTGDDLFQLKVGETSWTKIANVPELRFLIAAEGVLIIGSHTDWHRSTDEGETWTPMTPELKNQYLVVEGVTGFGDTIYALLSDSRQLLNGPKLLRSTDNGRSWATTEAGGLGDKTIDSMVALSEHVVCIGTGAGVFRWAGGEKSWQPINEGLIGTTVHSLVFFKNALYVTTYNNNGIFKSVDGGNRWMPIHRGLPTTNVGALTVSGGELYLGLNETNMGTQNPPTAGIYRLAANRNSWIPVQTEMRTDNIDHPDKRCYRMYHQMYSVDELVISGDTFYAIGEMGMGCRLFRWRRGERFWTDISPDKTDWLYDDLKELAVAGKTVYVHANGDLMRSRNKGKTWSELDIPTSRYGRQIEGLVVLGKTVYISISESGVFRSTDRGKTWESVNEGLPRAYSWELHAVENTLYATQGDKGIFWLRDGQDSWGLVASSPSDLITALAVAGTTLYAGMGGSGVYRIVLENPDSD